LLFHVAFAEELISRIQKLLVITLADELIELSFREALFVQIARIELHFLLEQETSCFAAGGSCRLLIKSDFRGHHFLRQHFIFR
jgi:hypothetical protein